MPQSAAVSCHAPARPPAPDAADGFTIVVDNLPPHVSTTQLYVVFRRYGAVLRAWRTHFAQGMVTYSKRDEALSAAKAEDHRMIHEQPLRVSAAFSDREPQRKGDWQCALCQTWNPVGEAACMGYMCGIQRTEGSIRDFERCLDPAELGSSMQYYQQPQTQAAQQAQPPQGYYSAEQNGYYDSRTAPAASSQPQPQQGQQDQYGSAGYGSATMYATPGADAGGYSGSSSAQPPPQPSQQPQQSGASTPTYAVTQVFPQQQPSQQPQQQSYDHSGTHTPRDEAYRAQQAPYAQDEVMPHPAPPPPPSGPVPSEPTTPTTAPLQVASPATPQAVGTQRHCVIVTNVPKNITERTLLKVFTKYATGGVPGTAPGGDEPPARGWVRPCTPSLPRALTEAHVIFHRREDATAAVTGESGRVVDNEQIRCVYAAEPFSVLVAPNDPLRWAHILASEADRRAVVAELGEVFSLYGAVDAIRLSDSGATIDYYSMTSAADAIIAEDGGVRLKGAKICVGLASGSRWPCTFCGRCNPGGSTQCAGCGAAIAAVDNGACWRWRDLMRKNVAQAAPPPPRYEPSDGYAARQQLPQQPGASSPAAPAAAAAAARHTQGVEGEEDPRDAAEEKRDDRDDAGGDAQQQRDDGARRRRRRGGRGGDGDGASERSDVSGTASHTDNGNASTATPPSQPSTPTTPSGPTAVAAGQDPTDAARRSNGSGGSEQWRRAPPPPPPSHGTGGSGSGWAAAPQPQPNRSARTGRGHRGGASRRK